MSLIKYDPFLLRKRNLFDDFFTRGISQTIGNDNILSLPAVNVIEKADKFELELAIPGLNKEDVKVNLDKDQIQIKAETKTEEVEEGVKFTRREFNYSHFSRNFILPKSVDKNRIDANYENGILKVTLNKREEEKDNGVKTIDIA
ncbi:MAG: Hsp20/alpha crystallin family protein [Bacteroidota bacterium]